MLKARSVGEGGEEGGKIREEEMKFGEDQTADKRQGEGGIRARKKHLRRWYRQETEKSRERRTK